MSAPLLTASELERLRLQTLDHWHRQVRRSSLVHSGPLPSLFRGHGLDIYDRRPYQPGDDIRHLDWRATARSGRPLTRVFLEERGRSLFLIVDRRPPMHYGSRREPKAASAARVAAILAFTALAAGERVGALLLEEKGRLFPASGRRSAIAHMLEGAAAPLQTGLRDAASLRTLWPEIVRSCAPGTDLCLISDFHDLDEYPPPVLHALNARSTVHAFQVRDAAEEVLPRAGLLRVRARGGTCLVDSDDPGLQRRYAQARRHHHDLLARRLADAAIPLHLVYNHEDTFRQLKESVVHAGAPHTTP